MWCKSHSAVARYELFSVDILITVVKFPNMSLFLMSYSELFFVSTNFLLHSRHFPHWIHLPYSPNQSNYLSINLSGICNRFYSLNNCKSGQPKTKQNFLYNFLYKNICGNHGRDSDFWYEQSWPNYAGVKSQICATELLTFLRACDHRSY